MTLNHLSCIYLFFDTIIFNTYCLLTYRHSKQLSPASQHPACSCATISLDKSLIAHVHWSAMIIFCCMSPNPNPMCLSQIIPNPNPKTHWESENILRSIRRYLSISTDLYDVLPFDHRLQNSSFYSIFTWYTYSPLLICARHLHTRFFTISGREGHIASHQGYSTAFTSPQNQ